MEYFLIYLPNILAALLGAFSLALLGSVLSARSESLQALVASQSAALGVTVGMLFVLIFIGAVQSYPLLPAVLAFAVAMVTYFISQKLCNKFRAKSTEILLVVFLATIALNYLITAAFPALEQHFSAAFMGDIATASALSSYWLCFVAFFCGIFFLGFYKKLLLQSFWISSADVVLFPNLRLYLYIVAAILIVESTRIFGFLFTASSLFCLPLGASIASRSIKNYGYCLLLLSMLLTLIGFVFSMLYQSFSTSASIVICQVLGSIVYVCLKTTKTFSK